MIPTEPALTTDERALLDRAASWPDCAWSELSSEIVRQIAEREGTDFATTLMYDRVCRSDEHATFIRTVDATLETSAARALLRDVTAVVLRKNRMSPMPVPWLRSTDNAATHATSHGKPSTSRAFVIRANCFEG